MVNESITSSISKLDYALHNPIGAPIETRQVEDDCVAGLQCVNHALKLRKRSYGEPIDARDYFTDLHFVRSHISRQSIGIDFFDVETLHAGQSLVGN
jgi:hypothetical protein